MKIYRIILLLIIALITQNLYSEVVIKKKKKKKKKNIETVIVEKPVLQELSQLEEMKFNYSFMEGLKFKNTGQLEKALAHFKLCNKIDSTSAATFFELAILHSIKGKFDIALKLNEKAVKYNPNNKWYLIQLAELYREKRMIPQAIEIYDKVKNLHPDDEQYYLQQASIYYYDEKWTKALELLNETEKIFGSNLSLLEKKLTIFYKLKQPEKAYEELNKLIEKHPNDIIYRGMLFEMYKKDNKTEKAFEQLQKMLEIEPDDGLTIFNIATHYLENKKYDESLKTIEKLLEIGDIEFIFNYFYLYNQSSDTAYNDEILKFTEKFSAQNPEIPETQLLYVFYLRKNKQNSEAKEVLLNVLNYDTLNLSAIMNLIEVEFSFKNYDTIKILAENALENFPNESVLYYYKGNVEFLKKDYYDAENSYLKGRDLVVDNQPLFVNFTSALADNYYKMGEKEKAFMMYEEVLLNDPDNILVLNNYSYYLSLEKENLDKALTMSRKCIDKEPKNSTYLDTYAWILFNQTDYKNAKYYIELAIENMDEANESGTIYEHYGDILFSMGDKERAIVFWEKAIKIGSEDDELLKQKIDKEQLIER